MVFPEPVAHFASDGWEFVHLVRLKIIEHCEGLIEIEVVVLKHAHNTVYCVGANMIAWLLRGLQGKPVRFFRHNPSS